MVLGQNYLSCLVFSWFNYIFFRTLYDMYRAWLLRCKGSISRLTLTEFTVAIGYIVGAALFVVGSCCFFRHCIQRMRLRYLVKLLFLISTMAGT